MSACWRCTAQTWYGHDALGSVRQTLDATGVPLAALSYDPWGLPQGRALPPTFGFTGELQDGTSGLVYLRARWYQPRHGRFLSRDPFAGVERTPASLHPDGYVYNYPVGHHEFPLAIPSLVPYPASCYRYRAKRFMHCVYDDS